MYCFQAPICMLIFGNMLLHNINVFVSFSLLVG